MHVSLGTYTALLQHYLRGFRMEAALLGLLLFGSITLSIATPQVVRYFIDTARTGGAMGLLLAAAIAYVGVAFIGQGIAIVEAYVAENLAWDATNELRADLALHVLKLDRSFHSSRTPGELIERLDGDVTQLANFFSRFLVYVVGNVLLVIGVVVAVFTVHWLIGVATAIFVVIALYVLITARSIALRQWVAVRQISAEFSGFLAERLNALEDIRANGAVAYVLRRMTLIYRRWFPLTLRSEWGWSATDGVTQVMFTLGMVVALALVAHLYAQGAISIGAAYLVFQYTDMLSRPLQQIRSQVQDLQRASASIVRFQGLLSIRAKVVDGELPLSLSEAPDVAFQHVSFAYETDVPVLKDVSFRVPAGSVLGVIGHTGSGKTTLTRLLLRMHDPDAGSITIDGHDIRQFQLAWLRRQVGVVTQEVQLFRASVRDNLAVFDPAIRDEHIETVLRDVGLGAWLSSLPNGLDSELATGSNSLSAGEGQLLAFARVFLRQPHVVLLDEATSRLDPATERLIAQATDRLLQGRTAIIIAHRLATLERADHILLVDGGVVTEFGERTLLASDPSSRYAQLRQLGLEAALA